MHTVILIFIVIMVLLTITVLVTIPNTSCSSQKIRPGMKYTNHTKEFVFSEGIDRIYRPYMLKDSVRYDMVELFVKVSKALDDADVKWFLSGGSMIGAVRHGGLIPWDDDIDISVVDTDLHKVENIDWSTIDCQLTKRDRLWKVQVKAAVRFPFVDIIPVKLHEGLWKYCLPFDKETGEFTYGVYDQWPKEAYPDDWVMPLRRVKWEHVDAWVPNKAKKLCPAFVWR